MNNINFRQFKVFASINHKVANTMDVRETFADMIYNNVNGIRAHALAMKIYNSEDDTEYGEDEIKLIRAVADKMCIPGFIDGLSEQLDNTKTE